MAIIYDEAFYKRFQAGSRTSADVILSLIVPKLGIKSMIDVGCGAGTWLAAARSLGISDLLGVEGEWVRSTPTHVDRELIVFRDLNAPLDLNRRFDLAISMEVAEHLSPDRSRSFVADLARLSDTVLFSAAIPGQGGTNHINERWQSAWAEWFAEEGLAPLDVIRARVWADCKVELWYRQNAILFCRPSVLESARERLGPPEPLPLDIVHPELFVLSHTLSRERFQNRSAREILLTDLPKLPRLLGASLRHRAKLLTKKWAGPG